MVRQERMTGVHIRKAVRSRRKGFHPPALGGIQWARRIDGFEREIESLTITLPCLPPSKNEYQGLHHMEQHKRYFRPWRDWFMLEHRLAGHPVVNGRVRVTIELHFPDNRVRDPLNFAAFPPLMDSLIKTGIIRDDSHQHSEIVPLAPVVDGTRRTVVVIVVERMARNGRRP